MNLPAPGRPPLPGSGVPKQGYRCYDNRPRTKEGRAADLRERENRWNVNMRMRV